jgi:hypothetical protein
MISDQLEHVHVHDDADNSTYDNYPFEDKLHFASNSTQMGEKGHNSDRDNEAQTCIHRKKHPTNQPKYHS